MKGPKDTGTPKNLDAAAKTGPEVYTKYGAGYVRVSPLEGQGKAGSGAPEQIGDLFMDWKQRRALGVSPYAPLTRDEEGWTGEGQFLTNRPHGGGWTPPDEWQYTMKDKIMLMEGRLEIEKRRKEYEEGLLPPTISRFDLAPYDYYIGTYVLHAPTLREDGVRREFTRWQPRLGWALRTRSESS